MKASFGSLKIWLNRGVNRWKLCFFGFVFVYALLLVFGFQDVRQLAFMSPQWDELPHLNGGLVLFQGHFQGYFQFGGYYPPLYDLVTAGFFSVGGASVFSTRLVSVVFSLLTLFAVFKFADHLYGAKVGVLASVMLAIMPGYFYLSRVAMIETMLTFFFTVAAFSFLLWLREHKNRFLVFSGLALGFGFLSKYQIILLVPIMVTCFMLFSRGFLKRRSLQLALPFLIACLIVVPWALISYQIFADQFANQWLYTLDSGNAGRAIYETGFNRFPQVFMQLPPLLQQSTFYFFEMTMPYPDLHPISSLMYGLSIAGLGWFAWRHKPQDSYLLVWFLMVYLFFSMVPNKEWRYVVLVFPVLALSAANLVASALSKTHGIWKNKTVGVGKKLMFQALAVALVVFTLVACLFSVQDAYHMTAKDQVQIPIEEASKDLINRLEVNQSIMVMCPQDLFTQDDFYFYLLQNDMNNTVLQYPEQPVDSFTPDFNITVLTNLCKDNHVKYVLLSENGDTRHYFNSTLDLHEVCNQIYTSGAFSNITTELTFGASPNRIFILTFKG